METDDILAAPYGEAFDFAGGQIDQVSDLLHHFRGVKPLRKEPEFIATIKARSAIRAQIAKQRQLGWTQTRLATGPTLVVLVYSGGQWRASTQWGALVESHLCYTECVRRAELRGFTPMSAA